MANGHGGRRPGAGRKSSETVEIQESRRGTFLRVVTDERWQKIVEKAAEQAESGDPIARQWMTPYVAGKVPDELKLRQDGKVVVEVVYLDADPPALPAPVRAPALPAAATRGPGADQG